MSSRQTTGEMIRVSRLASTRASRPSLVPVGKSVGRDNMTVASATKTIASKLSRKLRGDLVNVFRTFSSFAVATAYLFYFGCRQRMAGKRVELPLSKPA
jgi:hypothetical protein